MSEKIDYSHRIGKMDKAVRVLEGLPIADDVRRAVIGGNAKRLLRPDSSLPHRDQMAV